MALILTYREHQLLKAFRACDERGRHMVEQLAAQQAEASRTPPPGPATTERKPGRAALCRVK